MTLSRLTALKHKLALLVAAALPLCTGTANAQLFEFFGFPDIQVQPQQRRQVPQATTATDKVEIIYNGLFDYYLDNLEYTNYKRTVIVPSQTMHAVRLTPEIGIRINQSQSISHRIKIGMDAMKNMGDHEWEENAINEITLYYQIDARLPKAHIQALAGVYPRRYTEGTYGRAFQSDSLKFFDNNLEGFLFKLSTKNFFLETGLDWNSKPGLRRERITAFNYEEYRPADWLTLGFTASYTHLGGSSLVRGVVDNGLIEPFVEFDFSKWVWFDKFSANLGYLQAFQNDRVYIHEFVMPKAAELITDIGKWNLGIENTFTYGENMMPYYHVIDKAGNMYGTHVYDGAPYYQMTSDESVRKTPRIYDRFEIYYRPKISSYLDISFSSIIHVCDRSVLPQQMITLKFSLDRIGSQTRAATQPRASQQRGGSRSRSYTQPRNLQIL